MAVFQEPTQWNHELGNNADVSTLPDDTGATTGVASLQKLFQLINQTPLEAGGVAPEREDINALFKILGDSVFYGMNGGLASYNPDYDYVVGRYVVYNDTLYKCIQANGASSTVVAPDSVSPLGSDYWVQVATLADFANFANTDLSNLSASGQALFTNKADKDFSNVTAPVQAFKDMSVGWGVPDFSAKVTQSFSTNYTASSNGFIFIYVRGINGVTGTATINGVSQEFGYNGDPTHATSSSLLIPIAKSSSYTIAISGGTLSSQSYMSFIPCLGAN